MKRSTIIPLALLAYLGVMSYIGLPKYYAGDYFGYFGIIVGTLIVIVLLHFSLKRRERLRREREEDMARNDGDSSRSRNDADGEK